MQIKKFQRKIEDFICENCGNKIKGTGYTDHCPNCLYSKHVDINPGDRKSVCHGLMEPISVELKGDQKIIHYKCLMCGFEHQVKALESDNKEKLIELSTNPIKML
ncbi:RNHCP domain-containing protein [Candidatus Falkowbacteria bacterium]|nr:RNHCP domain-containing protein [Candidatus Falkowbacteria bacterium]